MTRKYPLCRYVPSPSEVGKEDNVKERENPEVKQFFGWAELRTTDNGNGRTDIQWWKKQIKQTLFLVQKEDF